MIDAICIRLRYIMTAAIAMSIEIHYDSSHLCVDRKDIMIAVDIHVHENLDSAFWHCSISLLLPKLFLYDQIS